MSDPFQQALAEALPALKKIQDGLGPKPHASAETLAKLQNFKAPARIAENTPRATASTTPRTTAATTPSAPAAAPAKTPPHHPSLEGTDWTLDTLRAAALVCVKCPHLVKSRTQVVFGVGNPKADLMFVGEAPGADEDTEGEPFVGKAGQLLTKIIQAMGFTRDEVYIANVLKCRPDMPVGLSGNRKPKPEEMATCLPWQEKQIELIRPKTMVALGATALEGLLGATTPVSKMRGKWLDFKGIPVMATYHPAYLLRNQSVTEKRKVWEDMLKVLEHLGKPISDKQRKFFTKSD